MFTEIIKHLCGFRQEFVDAAYCHQLTAAFHSYTSGKPHVCVLSLIYLAGAATASQAGLPGGECLQKGPYD